MGIKIGSKVKILSYAMSDYIGAVGEVTGFNGDYFTVSCDKLAPAYFDREELELLAEPEKNSLSTQVGGSHYKNFAIQPIEFVHKNNLNFIQGNVIKYICRYKDKNGIEDLKKVKHYVDMLIDLEYPNDK